MPRRFIERLENKGVISEKVRQNFVSFAPFAHVEFASGSDAKIIRDLKLSFFFKGLKSI